MRVCRLLLVGIVGAIALTHRAAAQSSDELYQQGVRAYQRLEFSAAAALFQRALDMVPRDSTGPSSRPKVLDYLAGSMVFRGNRDSAAAVFRTLLQADPRHHLDDLVFPPEVTGLFDDVRRNTAFVSIEASGDASIKVDSQPWTVRLLASSFHHVDVALLAQDSSVYRNLYSGPVWDTLTLQWNGRDSLGGTVRDGHYTLAVTSKPGERSRRTVMLPLDVSVTRQDTLPLPPAPPDSVRLPERTGRGPGMKALLSGLGLGLAVAALPAVVDHGANPSPARFAVGGAVSIAGIAGFLTHRSGEPIAANAAANRTRWDEWQAQTQAIARENAARRNGTQVRVKVGTPVVSGT
jgi:hypothetical protein